MTDERAGEDELDRPVAEDLIRETEIAAGCVRRVRHGMSVPSARKSGPSIAGGLQPCDSSPMTRSVAVIGAGPGGLVAARWLLSQGFEPTIFEQGPMLGGQWTGLDWPQRRVADHAHQQQSHHDGVQRPRARQRPRLPVEPRRSRLLASLRRDVRPYFAHPVAAPGSNSSGETTPDGSCVTPAMDESFERVVVASGRFHAPAIPAVPGLDTFAGSAGAISTYHYRGAFAISRQACARGRLRGQRPRDRRRTRPARRGACRGDPAATAVRPAEVRRRSPLRSPDLHAIRNAGERNPARSRDRPAAEGDRGRGRGKPGAVRRTGARPVALRRRGHPQPGVPASRRRGPNHGASVDGVRRGRDRDLRRRACRGVRRDRARHRLRSVSAVSE